MSSMIRTVRQEMRKAEQVSLKINFQVNLRTFINKVLFYFEWKCIKWVFTVSINILAFPSSESCTFPFLYRGCYFLLNSISHVWLTD